MPNNKHDEAPVIPVELIKETVMPPYEFQKPQNGFGSAGYDESLFTYKKDKQPENKTGKKTKS